MNLKKLISKNHLVPIYDVKEDIVMLVGYRRKASSRKANQKPFFLEAPVPIARLNPNPETELCNTESKK